MLKNKWKKELVNHLTTADFMMCFGSLPSWMLWDNINSSEHKNHL